MCFLCVYNTMQFSLMLSSKNHSRHSGLFERFGSKWYPWHGDGVLFSLCQVFVSHGSEVMVLHLILMQALILQES